MRGTDGKQLLLSASVWYSRHLVSWFFGSQRPPELGLGQDQQRPMVKVFDRSAAACILVQGLWTTSEQWKGSDVRAVQCSAVRDAVDCSVCRAVDWVLAWGYIQFLQARPQ
jgi:hypothetical protein